jgi:hypothetical protein
MKNIIYRIFFALLVILLFVFIKPQNALAQYEYCNPSLPTADNCDGEWTPDPGVVCLEGFRCEAFPPDIGGGECISCEVSCNTEGEPCPCCPPNYVCNDATNLCELASEPTCSVYGALCGPTHGFPPGEGEDGPCCPGFDCILNPVTGQSACRSPGDVCRALAGDCRDSCSDDEQPIGADEGGPGVDCPTSTPICCVFAGYPPGPERCMIDGEAVGINTAIGCIPVEDTQSFITFLLSWGIGIAGGIAFLLVIYAGFMITTSAGNPQRLQAGKELLTAAIMGLVLLVASTFILRVIGADILGIFP